MDQSDSKELAPAPKPRELFSFTPRNLKEALELAKMMSESELMPKDFRGKPGNVLVAVQMGAEIGLKPMAALQNIAVINGRPSLWGDALWALIKSSPLCEWTRETFDEATFTATCTIKRRGDDAVTRTFSKADAVTAKLWGKEGPWTNYPKRMTQMRARGFCSRDAIPEALKGFSSAEEQRDVLLEREVFSEPTPIEQPIERKLPDAPASADAGFASVASDSAPKASDLPSTVDKETGEIHGNTVELAPNSLTELATSAQRILIGKKMIHAGGITDGEMVSRFGFPSSAVPKSEVNAVLAWLDDPRS